MSAKILDGTLIARQHRELLAARVADHRRITAKTPGLGTILVGSDPASEVYVANKRRLASRIGMRDLHRQLPSGSTQAQVADAIDAMAEDPLVSGILH
jgi:methylenetetrahydrofolate dehydrogenase (NADP+)/methenyltetrahydrofolate cyclohydrolase